MYDPHKDYTKEDEVISVYAIINGGLEMNPGKVAGQCFHAGYALAESQNNGHFMQLPWWHEPSVRDWVAQGRRIVVRLAETEHVFNRCIEELEGFIQRDEGMTEVEYGSETIFITRPYLRHEAPKLLKHKKIQLF